MKADLHTHSTASDGMNSPAENVRLAKEAGLAAVGITDHDTVSGIDEALQMGEKLGIEVVPGIEMSTLDNNQDIHVLGYFIDYHDKKFLQKLTELQEVREKRNEMMIGELNELGIQISMDEVLSKIRRKGAKAGRPHIGEVLIEKGIVKSMEEAFDIYLGRDGKAYINPVRILPEEAIDIIKKAGGIPVLAHPGLYDDDELIFRLIRYGLAGIEVYHPDHSREDEKKYQQMAEKYGILGTAGSDFHGTRHDEIFHGPIGFKTVPYEIVEKLKSLVQQKR